MVGPGVLIVLLFAAATALAWRHLAAEVPPSQWLEALVAPNIANPKQMLLHYSAFPRMAVALLSGAALGLAGAVCQQVLRNPLAEPTTLGVSMGASLTVVAASLWAPWLFAFGREWVAMLGGFAAAMCVFGLAWGRGLSPLTLVLAGLIVSLYCGAVTSALALLNHDYLYGLYIWGAGFLNQYDWSTAAFLAPRLLVALALIVLMVRPLTVLGLDDETGRNLGLGLTGARTFTLVVAFALSASVVSVLGVLGFVGLAAPALVMLAGARRFVDRLIWAPLCGAGLLLLTDQLVQLIPSGYREMPTGAATALLGAPLLLVLLPRLRSAIPLGRGRGSVEPRSRHPLLLIVAGLVVLAFVTWMALAVGVDRDGWHLDGLAGIQEFLPWRWPRTAAALAAGAMLGIAGTLLQRMTGNPMAAPEVMGISSGAAMGAILLLFIVQAPSRTSQIAAGGIGALAVLAAILVLSRRSAYSPDRLLLAGVATSAGLGAIVAAAMASGDPRMATVLTWLAGSTYQVGGAEAGVVCAIAAALLAATVPLVRWLDILPLGAPVASSVGLNVATARFAIMLITAFLTAAATLVIGPLSFAGLMAPHMARMMGAQQARHHLALACVIGAVLMTLADWGGRVIIFPFQMPAGLLATMIGGPYLMWLLHRAR
ncbi:MAG: Fe(3+)-hydroxamate ABC transporter permease FhuB [Rhizobiales bacterium]|nr:Fe(3+)-hydroxamate ABC transporter permease FhuB [Hyphomicrobiales bacterium]